MYLPKCTGKPAKTVIIRLYRTAFRADMMMRAPTDILTILTSRVRVTPLQTAQPGLARSEIREKEKKNFGEQNEPRGRLRWERAASLADIFPNE